MRRERSRPERLLPASLAGISLAALLLWWCWPGLAPSLRPAGGVSAVVVLAEDPRRTEAALDRWLPMTQAWLVVHTGPPGQQASQAQLTARAPSPQALSRVERLTCGRDTLGQITCLAVALRRWRQTPGGPAIGSVILVTGQEHLSRALAIAQIVLGGQGLTVTGFPADTQGVPEDPLRTQRDRLRAQLWRATGWDGRPPFLSSEGRLGEV